MKNCNECIVPGHEALQVRTKKYVERLADFVGFDDLQAKLFQRSLLSHVEEYAAEERDFAGLNECNLKLRSLAALTFVLARDATLIAELDDTAAELLLREVEPPYAEVKRIITLPCNRERSASVQ